MSISGRTSASMTFSDDFVRSWLRSSRTVSWFASTSSLPPATKPTTSTRWNGDTSSFGWIGVSIGISNVSGPHAATVAAATKANAARNLLLLLFRRTRSIIDFLEELEILTDFRILRLELDRLLVGLA